MRTRYNVMMLFTAIYLSSPLLHAETSAQNDLVATGWYFKNENFKYQLPLLAVSNNQGRTWTYPANITAHLPADFKNYGNFDATDCNKNFCIAVGTYTNTDGKAEILLAAKKTQDNAWKYISTQPGDYADSVDFGYSHASCNSQLCAIALNYESKDGRYLPLLALSKDQGNSWVYPSTIISKLPSDFTHFGMLEGLDCKEQICAAIGSYDVKGNEKPLIAVSVDQGTSWDYPQLQALPNDALLRSIQCQQDFCVAVGFYETDKIRHPYIVRSANKGKSWEQMPEVTEGLGAEGQLESIQCDNNICIAAGYYENQKMNFLPLVATSKDSGKSWVYSSTIISALPEKLTHGANFLKSASCSGNNCVAGGVGFISIRSKKTALIAKSKDGGETWVYIPLETTDSIIDDAEITKVSCTQNKCIATGNYRNAQEKMMPLLAISNNGGNSWEFPSTIISDLPSDYGKAGAFSGSNALSSPMKLLQKLGKSD